MAVILPVDPCRSGERCCMIRAVSDKKNERADSRRIEERLERRAIAFESLFRLVEKLGATFDVGEIANILVTFMEERQVKRTAIYLVAAGRKRLEPQSAAAGDGALPSIPLESAFVRWLAEADGPVRLDEFDADAGQAVAEDEEDPRPLVEAGFSRAWRSPAGKGSWECSSTAAVDAGDGFRDCDDELCAMLARAASISIRNALLNAKAGALIQELERFSGAKRELIAGVAQDIRMPLAFLKSALWSLEPDAGEARASSSIWRRTRSAGSKGRSNTSCPSTISSPARADFEMESADVSSIVEDILREKLPELEAEAGARRPRRSGAIQEGAHRSRQARGRDSKPYRQRRSMRSSETEPSR